MSDNFNKVLFKKENMESKYIVGDLVVYTSLFKEPIAEICEIYEASYLIKFMNGNFAKVTTEEIKPIPLTLEILEKNGWKKDDRGYSFRDIIFLNKDNFGGWEVSIGENYILTITLIHELQHILFSLGFNYKIKI